MDDLALNWSIPSGSRFCVFGWSGIFCRKSSSLNLKSSAVHLVTFLRVFGRQLNSLGPFILKLFSFNVLVSGLICDWFSLVHTSFHFFHFHRFLFHNLELVPPCISTCRLFYSVQFVSLGTLIPGTSICPSSSNPLLPLLSWCTLSEDFLAFAGLELPLEV